MFLDQIPFVSNALFLSSLGKGNIQMLMKTNIKLFNIDRLTCVVFFVHAHKLNLSKVEITAAKEEVED